MSIWSRLLQHIHEWVFKMLFWPIHALGHSWMVLLDLCALLLSVWSCVRSHVYVIHLWQPKIAILQNVGNICHGNLQVGYTFKPSPTRYTKNNAVPPGAWFIFVQHLLSSLPSSLNSVPGLLSHFQWKQSKTSWKGSGVDTILMVTELTGWKAEPQLILVVN